MLISYKDIFKSAWKITIGSKFLWIFGIFAAFFSLENIYQLILGQLVQAQDLAGFYQNILTFYQAEIQIINNSLQALSLAKLDLFSWLIISVTGAVILLFIWLALTSQIFIINSASLLYRKQKVAIAKIFNLSSGKFWPILILNILAKLILYVAFAILSLPLVYLFLTGKFTALIYVNILFFIIYIIFALTISFIAAYASNYIILKNLHVLIAIASAWKLFKKNVLISLEVTALLFCLRLISLIIIFSLFLLFFIPLGIILALATTLGDSTSIIFSIVVLILAFTAISLFINSIYTVFYLTSFTLTFIKISEDTFWGKIMHYINNLPEFIANFARKNRLKIDQKKIKQQAAIIAVEAKNEAQIIGAKLKQDYIEYEPVVKKQAQHMARQAKSSYKKYKPLVLKESHKLAKETAAAYDKFEPIIAKRAKKILRQAQKSWAANSQPKKTSAQRKKS